MNELPDPSKPEWYWTIWKFSAGRNEGGAWAYIIHMEFEGAPGKTLCGMNTRDSIWDSGGMNLTETIPGCFRCSKTLRKRGLGAWLDRSIMDIKLGIPPKVPTSPPLPTRDSDRSEEPTGRKAEDS